MTENNARKPEKTSPPVKTSFLETCEVTGCSDPIVAIMVEDEVKVGLCEEHLEEHKEARKWVEVIPHPKRELEPGNMESIINYMMGTDKPFEAAIASVSSPEHPSGRAIRFFFKAPSMETQKVLRDQLEAQGLTVDVGSRPDFNQYDCEVELEATDDYAEPFFHITSRDEWGRSNPPDIAGTLASSIISGGALRFAFKRDPNARVHVEREATKLEQAIDGRPSTVESWGDIAFGGQRARGRGRGDESKLRRKRDKAKLIRNRASQGMLATDVRAYGTPHEVNSIISSLPFASNGFTDYRIKRLSSTGEEPSSNLDPSRHWPKKQLRKVITLAPLALLPLIMWLGWWRPWEELINVTRLIPFFLYWSPLFLAIGASALIHFAWRFKKPIVLSFPELTFLASLPRKVKSLPVRMLPEPAPTVRKESTLPREGESREKTPDKSRGGEDEESEGGENENEREREE